MSTHNVRCSQRTLVANFDFFNNNHKLLKKLVIVVRLLQETTTKYMTKIPGVCDIMYFMCVYIIDYKTADEHNSGRACRLKNKMLKFEKKVMAISFNFS